MKPNYDYDFFEGLNENYESDNYELYDLEPDYMDNADNEWTEEDSWDALTDGMYGDMPSSPWEYDAMMDAMGF